MSEPTKKPIPGSAEAYKASYERLFKLAPKELQAKIEQEQKNPELTNRDLEVSRFIRSVADDAEK